MTTMFPPIRQCPEGHNFCNKCSVKLMSSSTAAARKCPTCRAPLGDPVARARNLEQWATEADVEVTCDHEECGETFCYSQYAEHRKTCVGCVVSCPRKGCTWRGEPKDLVAHLQDTSEGGHALPACPNTAKYSNRHRDYSTTVIFETTRKVGHRKRWRPPRQLVIVPANPKLGTEQCAFAIALWRAKGANQPFLAAIEALRKPGHEETPWSYDISLSAYPRPPRSLCVSRASMCGTVRDLDAREVWARPKLHKCRSPVLVVDAASMALYNTANLDNLGNELADRPPTSSQRYEVHLRLMPLTAEVLQQQAQRVDANGHAFAHGGRAHGNEHHHRHHGDEHGGEELFTDDDDLSTPDDASEASHDTADEVLGDDVDVDELSSLSSDGSLSDSSSDDSLSDSDESNDTDFSDISSSGESRSPH